MPNILYKYNEPNILAEIKEHIDKTYGQYYVDVKTGIQVLDVYESIDIIIPFCQANAIKYLLRYGKKNGNNRDDLLKSAHYTMLLMHFTEIQDESS